MLGVCKTKPEVGGVELCEDLPVGEPGPGEIRLRVGATGICGTDLHIYHWVPWAAARMKLPTVLGHEIAGTVDAVGEGVTNVEAGDLVSLESHISCGSCYQCHDAKPHLCSRTQYPGIDIHGGLAEYLVVPSRIAWKHGKPLPIDVAAMFEPFGLAVHASLEGDGVSGRDVLITGCGPIGLMNVAVARALGAAQVIATDVNPKRLAAARQAGADRVIDVEDEDPVAITRDMTGGRGADVVFEYSGQASALAQAAQAVAAGGEIRLIGAPQGAIPIDLTAWILKGITVRSIHGRKIFGSWEQASRLVESGKVDLAPLVSHRVPLRDGVESFHLIERGEAVKVLVVPDA